MSDDLIGARSLIQKHADSLISTQARLRLYRVIGHLDFEISDAIYHEGEED